MPFKWGPEGRIVGHPVRQNKSCLGAQMRRLWGCARGGGGWRRLPRWAEANNMGARVSGFYSRAMETPGGWALLQPPVIPRPSPLGLSFHQAQPELILEHTALLTTPFLESRFPLSLIPWAPSTAAVSTLRFNHWSSRLPVRGDIRVGAGSLPVPVSLGIKHRAWPIAAAANTAECMMNP